jgi:hypothetical protein
VATHGHGTWCTCVGDIFRSKKCRLVVEWGKSAQRRVRRPLPSIPSESTGTQGKRCVRMRRGAAVSRPPHYLPAITKGAPTARLERVEVNFKGSYRAGSPPGPRRARHVARRPTSAVPALARPLPVSSSLHCKFLKTTIARRSAVPYCTVLYVVLCCAYVGHL